MLRANVDAKRKAKIRTFMALVITMLMVLSVMLTAVFYARGTEVFALTDTKSAYLAGSGAGLSGTDAELYDKATGMFNAKVLSDIKAKLFGSSGASQAQMVEYVTNKRSTKEDVTDSYIVNAPTINSSVATNAANSAYANTGMIIRLGGIDWMVVSMTLANGNKENDVILTLYQADSLKESDGKTQKKTAFSDAYKGSYGVQGDNMYASSRLRKNLTQDFTEYSLFQSGDFAEKYLVQPQYVTYQGTETQRNREHWVGYKSSATGLSFPKDGQGCHLPNDSYNARNDGGTSNNGGWATYTTTGFTGYKDSAFTYTGYNATAANAPYYGNPQRYDAWKNDYIWIPSATETGWNGTDTYLNGTASIWELSDAQRAHTKASTTEEYSWLRSGNYNYYNIAYVVAAAGTYNNSYVNNTNGVRPALHFNLSSAAPSAALENPGDLTTTYNGNTQTLKNIVDAKASTEPVKWYNTEYYDHADGYVNVEYYLTKEGTNVTQSVTAPKDAGTYWVKAEITDAWINAQRQELINAGIAPEDITDDMLPKFLGDPVTSDTDHKETARIRWFKIVINPKEVTLNAPQYNSTTKEFTPPSFANEDELYADRPILATRYYGTSDSGVVIDQINETPSKKGTYTAQAIFIKSLDDKTEYYGNYVIKNKDAMKCQVTIHSSRLPIVSAPNNNKPYTGGEVRFALSAAFTADWQTHATLKLPEGVKLDGSDEAGWALVVQAAGTYTITMHLTDSDYCWNTANPAEEITTDQSFQITVARKTIEVAFTSTNGGFLLQAGSKVEFGTEVNGVCAGDTVTPSFSYVNMEDPTHEIALTNGVLDASILTPGKYQLIARLDDSVADNKSYKILNDVATQDVTVSSKNIVVNKVNWRYSQNNGAPQAVPDGTTNSNPLTLTYNGNAFVFSIVTTGFTDLGVKVDTSFGSNGYKNATQTNATGTAVQVTVRLVPLDPAFAFNDENGNKLPNQYLDFSIFVKVDKAAIDFSKVTWNADTFEYDGEQHTAQIISGIPSFLGIHYLNNKGTLVGRYDASVERFSVKDVTEAANWNIPSQTEVQNNEHLKHSFEITRKRIPLNWSTTEISEQSIVVFLPVLIGETYGSVEYSYWDATKTTQYTLEEIFDNADPETGTTFYVKASLKASGSKYTSANALLVVSDEEGAEMWQSFTVGGGYVGVSVSLETDSVTYNGSAQPVVIVVDSSTIGWTQDDFAITYKDSDGNVLSGAPTNAGVYTVTIALDKTSEGNAMLQGQREFTYTINKLTYDVSGVTLLDENNAEYTAPYVWTYGVTHTMSIGGMDGFSGLHCNFANEGEGYTTASNAGTYTVELVFSVDDPLNCELPAAKTITWEITPYTPDLSAVTWNYYSEDTFVFALVDGAPLKHSAKLLGLPEGLEEILKFSGDTGEYSDAKSYTTSFVVDETHPSRGNWGDLVWPAGLDMNLSWSIEPLKVTKPDARPTKTFDPAGFTFEQITGFESFDWATYFDVTVADITGGNEVPIEAEGGSWKFTSVGEYKIRIRFKEGLNKNGGSDINNAIWSDLKGSIHVMYLTIKKLVFEIGEWITRGENLRPTINVIGGPTTMEVRKYFNIVIKLNENGSATGDNVFDNLNDRCRLEYDTNYFIWLELKEEYSGNVAANYNGTVAESTEPFAFKTYPEEAPETFFEKPTGDALIHMYEYTGEEIIFNLTDFSWFVPLKMHWISGSQLFGTKCGTYTMQVGFKAGASAAWKNDSGDGYYDYEPVTVTFQIIPKQVALPEEALSLVYNGHEQTFTLPSDLADLVEVKSGDVSGIIVGNYTITLALKDTANTAWADGTTTAEREITWHITTLYLTAPAFVDGKDSLVFNGEEQDGSTLLSGFDSAWMIAGGDFKMKDVYTDGYTMTVALLDDVNTAWAGDTPTTEVLSFVWYVNKKLLEKPAFVDGKDSLDFNDAEQDGTALLSGFDSAWMIAGGDFNKKDVTADGYTMTVALLDDVNTAWTGDTAEELSFVWYINKKILAAPTFDGDNSFIFSGDEIDFSAGLNGFDSKWMIAGGEFAKTDVGDYTMTITLSDTINTAWADGVTADPSFDWHITTLYLTAPTLDGDDSFVYSGEQFDFAVGLSGFDEIWMRMDGVLTSTNVGNFVLSINLNDIANTAWTDGKTDTIDFDWSVTPMVLTAPTLDGDDSFVYSGEQVDFGALLADFLADYMTLGGDCVMTNVGDYKMTVSLKDTANTEWADGTTDPLSFDWHITPMLLTAPTLSTDKVTYDGEAHDFGALLTNFDEVRMTKDGVLTATNAGKYVMTVSLADTANTAWADGTTEALTFNWNIAKRIVARPTVTEGIVYNSHERDITKKLAGFDKELMTIGGTLKGTNAGKYVATFTLKDADNYEWAASAEGDVAAVADGDDATIEFPWDIKKAKISAEWTISDENVPVLRFPDGFNTTNLGFTYVFTDRVSGKVVTQDKLVNGKEYSVTAKIKSEFAGNFEFVDANDEPLEQPSVSAAYNFTAENIGGSDGNGDGNNNGNNGTQNNGEKGIPYWVWIIVGVGGFLLLLLLLLLLLKHNKNNQQPPQPPVIYYPPSPAPSAPAATAPQSEPAEDISGENIWNGKYGDGTDRIIPVNEHSMTPDDWTFMVSEKDVLNADVLGQSSGNFVLYAVNKDDVASFKTLEGGEKVLDSKVAEDLRKAYSKKMNNNEIIDDPVHTEDNKPSHADNKKKAENESADAADVADTSADAEIAAAENADDTKADDAKADDATEKSTKRRNKKHGRKK